MDNKRFIISSNYDWEVMEQEVFLLEKSSLNSYVISGSGFFIWEVLQKNPNYKEIISEMQNIFPTLNKDEIMEINIFLDDLLVKGITEKL